MTLVTAGSCLFGAVQFDIVGAFESFFLCHCTRCQKDTGSAHAANLFASKATVNWTRGHKKVRTYQVPETRHSKSFCIECGSAVPRVEPNGTMVVVPAGSIDGAFGLRPSAHICCASRAAWDNRLESIAHFDGLPE